MNTCPRGGGGVVKYNRGSGGACNKNILFFILLYLLEIIGTTTIECFSASVIKELGAHVKNLDFELTAPRA